MVDRRQQYLMDILALKEPYRTFMKIPTWLIYDDDLERLYRVLPLFSRLQKIHFAFADIGPPDVKRIFEVLRENTTVELVTIESTEFGDESATCIGEMLRTNNTITNLRVKGGGIGNVGVVGLFRGIAQNKSLLKLYLETKRINGEGGRAIGEMLLKNHTIFSVSFPLNQGFSRIAKKEIVKGLKETTTLDPFCFFSSRELEASFKSEIEDYRLCKKKGLSLLCKSFVPDALWANVLARMKREPTLIYRFLTEKPELIKPISTRN